MQLSPQELARRQRQRVAALSERDAARYLGMSYSWLRHARLRQDEDAPPHIRLGKAVRYRSHRPGRPPRGAARRLMAETQRPAVLAAPRAAVDQLGQAITAVDNAKNGAGQDDLTATLCARWPSSFDRRERPPLSVGIFDQLAAELGLECSPRQLRRALGRWTGHGRYLERLAAPGALRVDLDGQPGEPVSAEHRAHALARLAARRPAPKPEPGPNAHRPVLRLPRP